MVSKPVPFIYSASAFAAKNSRSSMSACAVWCRSPVVCRIRWPNWLRSSQKAIGVGQYHTMSQSRLAKTLDAIVGDCVNACRRRS